MGSTESLSAPYSIEFPFDRTVGPTIGVFLGGLRDGQLYGVRTADGSVLCPAAEFDPETGAETGEFVLLEPRGTVTAWTFGPNRPGDPVEHPFAWALITIDGTRGGFFHAVDVGGDESAMRAGMRVQVRWRAERVGTITDIVCFEPEVTS